MKANCSKEERAERLKCRIEEFLSKKDKQWKRRNLTPDQMSLLRGRRYNRVKKTQGAPIGNDNRAKQRSQNEPFEKTADSLAKEHGGKGTPKATVGQNDTCLKTDLNC
ncbi:MAG: hypothetical protein WAW31_13330 [Smithella sp.]